MAYFKREDKTYAIKSKALDSIQRDPSSPIRVLGELLHDKTFILDIGCGNGLLAKYLRSRHTMARIHGVEPHAYAANLAKPYYDIIESTNIESVEVLVDNKYDAVVLADVIEHASDPEQFLSHINKFVSNTSSLYISMPNVAFGANRIALLNGHFNYRSSGILEKTHLRFFTLDSISKLVNSCGYKIVQVYALNRSWFKTEFPEHEVASFLPSVEIILKNKSHPLAYQFILVCEKLNGEPSPNKTKIIHIGPNRFNAITDLFLYKMPLSIRNRIKQCLPCQTSD